MEEKERVELHNMEKKERVELLLQCLPDSYDHLIIYVVNGVSRIMVIFNDVVAIVLKEGLKTRKIEYLLSKLRL